MTLLSGHSHGGEVYALARRLRTTPDKLLDFSSNANIFARDITEELVRNTPYPFLHYPDTKAEALQESIAGHENVNPNHVLPGNGGAELIWLTLQALAPRKILFIGPVFSEYVAACHAFDLPYTILTPAAENYFTCTAHEMQAIWDSDADLVVICTPNNPAAVTYDNILSMLRMLRAPRVLIDNSYREFLYGTDDYPANHQHVYLKSLRPGISLLTLHSFTKFFCCPGIRLGYLLGERTVLARIESLRPSWTVSPFAQHMGQKFLADIERYRSVLPALNSAVTHMGRELRRLDCIHPDKVFEGPGFLCCGLAPRFHAADLCEKLLKRRIVARNCDAIPGMPSGYIRLQARREEDVSVLLRTLENVFSS